jgi:hypothetical protein
VGYFAFPQDKGLKSSKKDSPLSSIIPNGDLNKTVGEIIESGSGSGGPGCSVSFR